MTDPIADLIGDYRAFTALQRDRLAARGIDIAPYELSHLAVRVPEWDQYVHLRTLLERHAIANRESVWNGRPISLILLAEPLRVLDGQVIPMIELIPPVHQRVYKMGMEHFGVVVGEEVDAFSRRHRAALTGQQFQSASERAVLRPVRGLHPREVPPPLAAGGGRAGGRDVRRLPPRRRLGPAAAGHGDRPEPPAPVNEPRLVARSSLQPHRVRPDLEALSQPGRRASSAPPSPRRRARLQLARPTGSLHLRVATETSTCMRAATASHLELLHPDRRTVPSGSTPTSSTGRH